MASPKRRIGNYSQNVTDDPEGILKSVSRRNPPKNMNKTEKSYYRGTGGRDSAADAIEKVRSYKKKGK